MLDTYIVKKVGNALYEVRRYKNSDLMESATVDITKNPRSDFETKRMAIARRYASEGCPKGSAFWFGKDGSISRTKLAETDLDETMYTRKHFQSAADHIRAISDPKERQDRANYQAGMFARDNPRFDHARFHAAAGTQYQNDSDTLASIHRVRKSRWAKAAA